MENLLVEIDEASGIARVVLNQPEKRNAISMGMWKALPEILGNLKENIRVKVVILTGAAGHFAGGADISEFKKIYADDQLRTQFSELVENSVKYVSEYPKPVIAMISGSCVGAGCALATACDIRFCDETARFGIPPGKLGLIYSLANTRRLAELIGRGRASDLLFTGRVVDAKSAHQWGLVDFLQAPSDLEQETYRYARSICAISQNSVQTTKRILRRISEYYPDDDATSWQEFLDTFESDDFREGYQAFLEKRPPSFDGDD